MGDAHIYEEHIENVHQQLDRTPKKKPTLKINRAPPPNGCSIDEKLQWLETLMYIDIVIEDYEPFPAIKYKMIA